MEGAFITLEGTDSAILAAQLSSLSGEITERGYEVESLEFPRSGEPSSYFAAQYLQGYYGPAENINSYAGSMFYALDHHEAATRIRTALSRGKIVIVSRYTGAVMAEQGAKISNPEQRKGYYLWLENLAYTLLGTPRPHLSIVLRVPAVGEGSKAGESYDEISQVFPKDYWQLHTVPVGKKLSASQINNLILDRIKSLLPEPPARPRPLHANPENGRFIVRIEVSGLARLRLAEVAGYHDSSKTDLRDAYYVPPDLPDEIRDQYNSGMDTIRELRNKIQTEITGDGSATALNDLIPIAALHDVAIEGSEHELSGVIARLEDDRLPESNTIIGRLTEVMGVDIKRHTSDQNPIAQLAPQTGSQTHGGSEPGNRVRLIDYYPRNELLLVPDMLFGESTLTSYERRRLVESWPYDQKEQIYKAYINHVRQSGHDTRHALDGTRFTFEIVTKLSLLSELRRHGFAQRVVWQELTPRNGFDVPDLIESAGLTETYESCFDISMKLHSLLHASVGTVTAQYAVLSGHNARALLTLDGAEMLRLQTLRDADSVSDDFRQLINSLVAQAAVAHPLLFTKLSAS